MGYLAKEELTLDSYTDEVLKDSRLEASAAQRMFHMIDEKGKEKRTFRNKKVFHYNFFDDAQAGGNNGPLSLIGLDESLAKFVGTLQAAGRGLGTEKRLVLLHGPVGSAKSTLATLLKRGMERYTLAHPLSQDHRRMRLLYRFGIALDRREVVVASV